MEFHDAVEFVGLVIDGIGVVVIVLAVIVSLAAFGVALRRGTLFPDAYRALRHTLGRGILLGLELLVAADIIRTVAVSPTIESVAVLAAIVAVRTFLSFSLEVELEGSWPWARRREADARDP